MPRHPVVTEIDGMRLMNIAQVKKVHTGYWFSNARYHKAHVASRIYLWDDPRPPGAGADDGWGECRLWIESSSTSELDSPKREWKIVRFSLDSRDIGYLGAVNYEPVTWVFDSFNDAVQHLHMILDGKVQPR